DGQIGFARPGRADAQGHVVLAHGPDVAPLAVGAGADEAAAALGLLGPRLRGRRRRLQAVAALLHHFEDGADALRRQLAVVAQQLPQLGEDALGLVELLVAAFDEDGVAAGHELDAQAVADLLEEAVAAAEQAHGLATAVQL